MPTDRDDLYHPFVVYHLDPGEHDDLNLHGHRVYDESSDLGHGQPARYTAYDNFCKWYAVHTH